MKKALSFLMLTAVAGALVTGVAVNSRNAKVAVADGEYRTYIPLTEGWIEHTDGSSAKSVGELLRGRNERFWSGNSDQNSWDSQERTFNGMDDFIDTIHKAGGEGWRGNYRTPELTLHDNNHRYISFLFGGGASDVFINVWHVRTTYQGNLIDDKEGDGDRWIAKYGEGYDRNVIRDIRPFFDGSGTFDDKEAKFNAPRTCNMTFRYYRLPDSIEVGDQFLIFVRDGKTEGYGGFTFGDVQINQTLEDVARSFSAHKTQMKLNSFTSTWNENANNSVLNFYATDNYYAEVRAAEAALTDANDSFEVNNRLSKWAYDQQNSTYENGDLASIDFNGIYGDKTYKWGGYFYENDGLMPLNADGNYLTGEPNDVDCNNCGLPETAKYRLISPEFTLSGTGLISAKLGGHYTALQLLDSNLNVIATTGNENPSFADEDMTNIVLSGGRQCTMTRTYLDCGAFVGQRVHVALADTRTGRGWNLSYFDEVSTKYLTLPALQADLISQSSSKSENVYHGFVLDEYVDNGHNDIFKEAHSLFETYYSNLRSPSAQFAYESANKQAKAAIYNVSTSLSSDAVALVNASEDVTLNGEYSENWYLNGFTDGQLISSTLPTLLTEVDGYSRYEVSFDKNGASGDAISPLTLVDGSTFLLPECTFDVPAGKKFKEWNTQANGEGVAKQPNDEYLVEGDVTFHAIWVDTAKTKVEALNTRALLSYDYSGNSVDGFTYSNVKIRLGGVIAESLWEELNEESEIQGYGVMVSLASEKAGYIGSKTFETEYATKLATAGNVDDAISALCDGTYIIDFYKSLASQMPYQNVLEETYSWNLVQSVNSPKSLKRTYVAVAYVRTADGVVFLNETRVSAKSLAQSMIDGPEYDEDSLGGSLKNLAELA